MKKTGLRGYAYNYLFHYDSVGIAYILDIHKYLTKKHDI